MAKREFDSAKLKLLIASMIFGTTGVLKRFIPMSSAQVACFRGIIGAILIVSYMVIKGIKIDLKAVKANLGKLVLSGIIIGLNWLMLYEAYNYTTIPIAIICYYMQPVIVIITAPIILKERISNKKLLCVLVACVGTALISGLLNISEIPVSQLKGVILALCAAFLYASVILINQKIRNISAYDKTIAQILCAGLIMIPYILFTKGFDFSSMNTFGWVATVWICVINTGIAYVLYFGSMSGVKASTIALYSYIDPVMSIILSALVLNEVLTLPGIIGAILVLGATIVSERVK